MKRAGGTRGHGHHSHRTRRRWAACNSRCSWGTVRAPAVDHAYLASTLAQVFRRGQVLRSERRIVEILSTANKAEFNTLVESAPLAPIFYKVKDHATLRWWVDRMHDAMAVA